MSNFTPGPWEASGNSEIIGIQNAITLQRIAFIRPANWANAELMAAAPELYETLKELINRLYHNAMAFHELPELMQNELINKGRRALAKAKGE